MTDVDQTANDFPISFTPYTKNNADSGVYMNGSIYAQTMNVGWSASSDGATGYNTSTVIISNMSYITPSYKNTTAMEVGYLALGAGDENGGSATQNFGTTNSIVTWNLPGYFWYHNITPSFSHTLQVGSAALQYPISLIFGGYDQGRMIGASTTFNGSPSLLDIGIGVQTGGSPFNFTSKSGLLVDSNGDNKQISASPDPQGPYLSLPRQTCDAIAAFLPVMFDNSSGYYLWQVNHPDYEKIVSSPTYLSFIFPPATGSTKNVIIKVPFMLLNLTLGPLLSGQTQPVPYFPCRPFTPDRGQPYILGRAFLQAALLGRNWNTAVSWLAQAPGPGLNQEGLGISYQNIASSSANVTALPGDPDEQFVSTWSGYWKPLPDATVRVATPPVSTASSAASATGGHSGSLSIVAEAAIGAGVGAVVLASLAGVGVFFRRRKKDKKLVLESRQHAWITDCKDASLPDSLRDAKYPPSYEMQAFEEADGPCSTLPAELPACCELQELDTEPRSSYYRQTVK